MKMAGARHIGLDNFPTLCKNRERRNSLVAAVKTGAWEECISVSKRLLDILFFPPCAYCSSVLKFAILYEGNFVRLASSKNTCG